ncbi:MAG: peptidoglycan DD-metalloendopeptidase family protein [Coleofasciculaceae cyanobacterium]
MKQRYTQKVKQVPSCAAESLEALSQLPSENHQVSAVMPTLVNRRARTSAAMIGLAISMGASGLLLPQQGDEAMAIEPASAEPRSTTLPVGSNNEVSASPVLKQQEITTALKSPSPAQPAIASEKEAASPVVEHEVKKGQTLWELSKTYEIKPEAIAASNKIQPSSILPVGQKLKIPSVNGIAHEVKTGETVESLSKSYGVEQAVLISSAGNQSVLDEPQAGEVVTVPGNVNELLQARQGVALEKLKEQRNRLNSSLAELGSEEFANQSEETKVAKSPSVDVEQEAPVTLPPVVPLAEDKVAKVEEPRVSVPTYPSVVIPVSNQATTAVPTVKAGEVNPSESVVIPVPSPKTAASLAIEGRESNLPDSEISTVAAGENSAQRKVPQPVGQETLVAARPVQLYQVKPGDTIYEIARRHGLSRSEIVSANGLKNPSLISVNQTLRIPQSNSGRVTTDSVTLIPPLEPQSSTRVAAEKLPALRGANSGPSTSGRNNQDSTLLAQSEVVVDAQPNYRSSAKTRSTQPSDAQNSEHIENLRAEILKLREEYRQNGQTGVASKPNNVVVPTQPTATDKRDRPSVLSRRDLRIDSNREPLEQENSQRPNTPVAIEVPQPKPVEQVREQPQPVAVGRGSIAIPVPEPEQKVATAPVPPANYNPSINPRTGEMVSPDLPPLSDPDRYLPDSPARFNGYIWPAKGVLTSGYGRRWGRMHKGIDIAAPIGTPIMAAAPGVVVTAGWNSGGYGKLVEIKHPDGSLTLYAHNNRILVRRGQEVAQGQQISEMGSTGYSTGPHLHFEVHPSGRGAVNPVAYLPRGRR